MLTDKRYFETPDVTGERLRSESVAFVAEDQVNLEAHRWSRLRSLRKREVCVEDVITLYSER